MIRECSEYFYLRFLSSNFPYNSSNLYETIAQRLKRGLIKYWPLFNQLANAHPGSPFCTHFQLGHLTHFHSWFSEFLQLSSVLKLFLPWQRKTISVFCKFSETIHWNTKWSCQSKKNKRYSFPSIRFNRKWSLL